MKKMTYNRIIGLVLCALMMVGFFVCPYFHSSLMTIGGALGGLLGQAGDEVSEVMSGLSNLSMFRFLYMLRVGGKALTDIGIEWKQTGMPEFLLKYCSSGVLPLALLILFIPGGKVTKIGGSITAGLLLAIYLIQILLFPQLAIEAKYSVSMFYYAFPVLAVAALVMALLEKTRFQGTSGGEKINIDPDPPCPGPVYVPAGGGSEWIPGTLYIVGGTMSGASIPIKDGETVTIGRNPASCNLIFPEDTVSRVHCHITYDSHTRSYQVLDVSSYGIFDGVGSPLPPNEPVWMHEGDILRIGNTENRIQLGDWIID